MDGTLSEPSIPSLFEIQPSTFKSSRGPMYTEKINKINIPKTNSFKQKLMEADSRSLSSFLSPGPSSRLENFTTIFFIILSAIALLTSIYTYYYVQRRKENFFVVKNLSIKNVDVNGVTFLDQSHINQYIFVQPRLNFFTTDSLVLPNLYSSNGDLELLSTGNVIAIFVSFVQQIDTILTPNPANPYLKVYKFFNDPYPVQLYEGQGVIFTVTRISNVLTWIVARKNDVTSNTVYNSLINEIPNYTFTCPLSVNSITKFIIPPDFNPGINSQPSTFFRFSFSASSFVGNTLASVQFIVKKTDNSDTHTSTVYGVSPNTPFSITPTFSGSWNANPGDIYEYYVQLLFSGGSSTVVFSNVNWLVEFYYVV